jgi:hypothetical protein
VVNSSSPYKQGLAMLLILEAGWNGKADYARSQQERWFGDRNCMRMRDLLSHCPLFLRCRRFWRFAQSWASLTRVGWALLSDKEALDREAS